MKLDKVIAVRTNKTVYRDGHLAIKVFDSDYSKADVLNEALNQARVEETALNIPRLHEVCTVGGKWAIVSDFIPGKTLARLKDKMNRKIDETGLDATTRYELHARLQGMPNHKKLCHGDFDPKNIILRDDGEAFILDWSHATQGNASADAARTYLLFWLAGDIDGAESYLHLFCKKSDTARQYVQKWIPIVAASQSVKGRAEEREFLLHWVNVVDYE